jgi:hypothetical protein
VAATLVNVTATTKLDYAPELSPANLTWPSNAARAAARTTIRTIQM